MIGTMSVLGSCLSLKPSVRAINVLPSRNQQCCTVGWQRWPHLGRIDGLQDNLPKALGDSHKVCGRDTGPIPNLFDGSPLLYVILCPPGPTLHPQQYMLQGLHDSEKVNPSRINMSRMDETAKHQSCLLMYRSTKKASTEKYLVQAAKVTGTPTGSQLINELSRQIRNCQTL